jgi:diguanylate cyclase (GGDEF)-like protein
VLDESLRDETLRSQRYGYPVALAILDLDHFKAVNDRHGHPAGDVVLRAFARLACSQLRESDAIHRYGGEEFAVLLAHTPLDGALEAARRIVRATRETPVAIGSTALTITVSAGVACLRGKECEAAALVAQADAALYEAKGSGRDRAVAFEPSASKRPAKQRRRRS